jgi:hypothetical protein
MLALTGATVTLAALFARAAPDPLNSLWEAPVLAMPFGIIAIEVGYRLTFGRAKLPLWQDIVAATPMLCLIGGILADLAQLGLFWQQPTSVGALLFTAYATWILVRDWPYRPHYVLLCAAAIVAMLMTIDVASVAGHVGRLMAFLRAYAVLGAAIAAVGLLDHQLLLTSLRHGTPPPPTVRQRVAVVRGAFVCATTLVLGLSIALAVSGGDDSLLAPSVSIAFTASFLVFTFRYRRPFRRRVAGGDIDFARLSPFRVPLTTAPLVMCFAMIDAAALDVLTPAPAFPLGITIAVGAASAWWARQDWPSRRHYLLGSIAAAATAIALVTARTSPTRAFTWFVLTAAATLAVETFIDYRALRRHAGGGSGEVHVDAV